MKKELIKNNLAAVIAAMILVPAALSLAADDDNLPGVVKQAKMVEESKTEASFHVPEKGQVWLYDVNDKQVVHSISVREGNFYEFDTRKSAVRVNSKEGAKVELNPKHTYRIYYVTAAARDKNGPADEKSSLPETAKRVAEIHGKDVVYKAPTEGTVYLWNSTENELLNTFHVMKNQVLAIEPERNRVALEDKVILKDADLSTKAMYRLLFDEKR